MPGARGLWEWATAPEIDKNKIQTRGSAEPPN